MYRIIMRAKGVDTMKENAELSRRNFLKGSALALGGLVAAPTLLTGCAANPNDHLIPPKPSAGSPPPPAWLGAAPEIPAEKISDTYSADIVIVGAGLAGLTAARAASEHGASVLVMERASTWQCRSGQFGTIGNRYQRELGISFDKNAAILENMKQMGYRADQRMWNYWAEHSGEDFDWMLDLAPAVHVMKETDTELDRTKINLQMMHYPLPSGYNRSEENSPTYPTVMTLLPSQEPLLTLVYEKCLAQGCKFIYATRAKKLVREEDGRRVTAVIGEDIHGKIVRCTARKAVILATGDYGNNKEMMAYFVPWAVDYLNVFPNRDAWDTPTNTGDGHRMAAWVGGKIEDGPHAPMIHTLGGPLGVDAYLLLNDDGQRFVNEDIGGQQLSCAIYRQRGNYAWQIFDDNWPEQLGAMGVSHGSVNHCVPAAENPKLPPDCQWAIGRTSYTSREDLDKTPGLIKAGSIEELAAALAPDRPAVQRTILAEIAHYNELANAHQDRDFGKASKRLFPLEKPPFYAGKMLGGALLVNMGGLTVNPEDGNVLDAEYHGIPGLYAAGNTQGGRFVGDYPVVTAGVSHAFALVYGRLVGNVTAQL